MQKGVTMRYKKFQDIMPTLVDSGGLLDKAADALKQKLVSQPRDSQTLWLLGQVCRGQGKFKTAAEAYQRFVDLHPENQLAAYLVALLQSQDLPVTTPQPGLWPVPFVYMPSFLSQAQHDQALALAFAQQDKLQRASVRERGNVDLNSRSSWVLLEADLESVRSWFLSRIQAVLPTIMPRLQLAPFDIGSMELQMTVHRAGDFYTLHLDQDANLGYGRLVSYVYYFYYTPKRFTGGDLLLYDTDVQKKTCSAAFTRIVPRDNSIIFFSSHYWHQVSPVCYTTHDVVSGRFTLNGWVHAKTN